MLAINSINAAIDSGQAEATLAALQNPAAQLPPVVSEAGPLYLEELGNMKLEKQAALDQEEIAAGLTGKVHIQCCVCNKC